MLDKLFNSKTRVKVLALFFQNETKRFYIQEIIKKTKTDPANTHRELVKLQNLSILDSQKTGNQKYYFINKDSLLYPGLKELLKIYTKNSNPQDEWFMLEEIPPKVNPNVVAAYMDPGPVNQYLDFYHFISRITRSLIEFNKKSAKLYFLLAEFDELAQEIYQRIMDDPDWGKQYIEQTQKDVESYFLVSREVYNTKIRTLSDAQLLKLYQKLYEAELKMRGHGWIQNTLEMRKQLFSNYLLSYLTKKLEEKNYNLSTGDVFSTLTTPIDDSYAQQEYQDLLVITKKILKNKSLSELFKNRQSQLVIESIETKYAEINALLSKHTKKYGWLSYQYEGPGWQKEYFVDVISGILQQGINVDSIIQENKKRSDITKEKQYVLLKDLEIDEKHQKLFQVAQGMVYTKGSRKDSMFYGFCCQDFINKEIARRNNLSIDQVRNLYPKEVINFSNKNKNLSKELNERLDYHIGFFEPEKLTVLMLEDAKNFMRTLPVIDHEINDVINELEGTCASPGKVRGVVHLVNTIEEMKKFKEGNILVSIATSPDLMPAIRKSAAIVTDMGGMTCHAAIVSRELGKPCVIGTQNVTKILKNGDLVEVNATHGKINIIKRSSSKNE